MDVRHIFMAASEELLAKYRTTSSITHAGAKGTVREDHFEAFLRERLPQRYSVGKGEVVTPENQVSGQLDLVVFDSFKCPKLFSSEAHSIFPIESIYGAISIKSNLESGDLKDAYANIASLKRILLKAPVNQRDYRGLLSYGLTPPVPVTGVFAYNSRRRLEAIHKQVESLDQDLSNIELRPDFVAVLGTGLIGPRIPLRGPFNVYQLPKDKTNLAALRKTGRHTLLRLYLELLRELNMIQLLQFDLTNYDNMPRFVGPFRVRSHNDYFRSPTDSHPGRVSRINEVAIREIVQNAKPVTLKEVYHHYLGFIPQGIDNSEAALSQTIYEYNPKDLPPISFDQIDLKSGRMTAPAFVPDFLEIDGKLYAADIGVFTDEHFEEDPLTTFEELFSQ